MILCNKSCYPCCDFCIYVQHETIEVKDKNGIINYIRGGPLHCTRYNDKEHNDLAFNCSFCNEFHCNLAEWPEFWYLINLEDWKENNP